MVEKQPIILFLSSAVDSNIAFWHLKITMNVAVGNGQSFMTHKKRSPIEVNKALTVMGFGTWNGLEPGTSPDLEATFYLTK